ANVPINFILCVINRHVVTRYHSHPLPSRPTSRCIVENRIRVVRAPSPRCRKCCRSIAQMLANGIQRGRIFWERPQAETAPPVGGDVTNHSRGRRGLPSSVCSARTCSIGTDQPWQQPFVAHVLPIVTLTPMAPCLPRRRH